MSASSFQPRRSLLFGLMWWDPKPGAAAAFERIRHEAKAGPFRSKLPTMAALNDRLPAPVQMSDGLDRYGWQQHDGSTYGTQEIIDGDIQLVTSFAKRWPKGSGPGGDWALRVEASRIVSRWPQGANCSRDSLARCFTWSPGPQEQEQGGEQAQQQQQGRVVSLLTYMQEEVVVEGHERMRPSDLRMYTVLDALKRGGKLAYGRSIEVGSWALHLRPPRKTVDEP